MSKDGRIIILWYLHFAKNLTPDKPQPENRLCKVNPLLDKFYENIDRMQYLTKVFAIDASMVL